MNKIEIRTLVARKYLHLVTGAARRGIEFNLNFSQVRKLVTVKHCQVTGILFSERDVVAGEPVHWNHRTIDRIDQSIGYVPGNVVAVLHGYNHMKNMLMETGNYKHEYGLDNLKKILTALGEL